MDVEESTEPTSGREYRWNFAVAVILSVATLASAWCGFQASSWGSVYSHETRTATGERFVDERASAVADRQLTSDLMIFSTWLQAEVNDETPLANEIEARFQPHFLPAFVAWRALPVDAGALLPPGTPFEQPEYVLPSQVEADAAHERALAALAAADVASTTSTRYVLTSVLFASVLFLAGIASKLSLPRLAHAVVGVAGAALVVALTLLLTSPMQL